MVEELSEWDKLMADEKRRKRYSEEMEWWYINIKEARKEKKFYGIWREFGKKYVFGVVNAEEKQKFIDNHPKMKEFQNRKREIERKYGM